MTFSSYVSSLFKRNYTRLVKLYRIDYQGISPQLVDAVLSHDMTNIQLSWQTACQNSECDKTLASEGALRCLKENNAFWLQIATHLDLENAIDDQTHVYRALKTTVLVIWERCIQNKERKKDLLSIFQATLMDRQFFGKSAALKLLTFNNLIDMLPLCDRGDFRILKSLASCISKLPDYSRLILVDKYHFYALVKCFPAEERAEVIELLPCLAEFPNRHLYELGDLLQQFPENRRKNFLKFSLPFIKRDIGDLAAYLFSTLQDFSKQGWASEELRQLLSAEAILVGVISDSTDINMHWIACLLTLYADLFANFSDVEALQHMVLFIAKVGVHLHWKACFRVFNKFRGFFKDEGFWKLSLFLPTFTENRIEEWQAFLSLHKQWPNAKKAVIAHFATITLAFPLALDLEEDSHQIFCDEIFKIPFKFRGLVVHLLVACFKDNLLFQKKEARLLLMQRVNAIPREQFCEETIRQLIGLWPENQAKEIQVALSLFLSAKISCLAFDMIGSIPLWEREKTVLLLEPLLKACQNELAQEMLLRAFAEFSTLQEKERVSEPLLKIVTQLEQYPLPNNLWQRILKLAQKRVSILCEISLLSKKRFEELFLGTLEFDEILPREDTPYEILNFLRCLKDFPETFPANLVREISKGIKDRESLLYSLLIALFAKLPYEGISCEDIGPLIDSLKHVCDAQHQKAFLLAVDKFLPAHNQVAFLRSLAAHCRPANGMFLYAMIDRLSAKEFSLELLQRLIDSLGLLSTDDETVKEMLKIFDCIYPSKQNGLWNIEELLSFATPPLYSSFITARLLLLLHRAAPAKRKALVEELKQMSIEQAGTLLRSNEFCDLFVTFFLPEESLPAAHLTWIAENGPDSVIKNFMKYPFGRRWAKRHIEEIIKIPCILALLQEVYPTERQENFDIYPLYFRPARCSYDALQKTLYITCPRDTPLKNPDALFDLLSRYIGKGGPPIEKINVQHDDGKAIDGGAVARQLCAQLIQGLLSKSSQFRFAKQEDGTVMPIPLKDDQLDWKERYNYLTLGRFIGLAAKLEYPIGEVFYEGLFHAIFAIDEEALAKGIAYFSPAIFLQKFSHERLLSLMEAVLYARDSKTLEKDSPDPYQIEKMRKILCGEDSLIVRSEANDFLQILGMDCGASEEKELPLEDMRALVRKAWLERFTSYFTVAHAMAMGMREIAPLDLGDIYLHVWDGFAFETVAQIAQAIQGELCRESLKKNIQIVCSDKAKATMAKRCFCKWIDAQKDKKALRSLIQTLSGGRSLTRQARIIIKLSAEYEQISIHACFHSVDVPLAITEEAFMAMLDSFAYRKEKNPAFDQP